MRRRPHASNIGQLQASVHDRGMFFVEILSIAESLARLTAS